MEKEINSQVNIIENLVKKYIVNYCVIADIPMGIRKVVFVASGSSYNASLFGKYFFEQIANIPSSVEFASEFLNSTFTNFDSSTLYIFISQSGQSFDTVESAKKVLKSQAKTLCITNNPESQLYKICEYKYNIEAGEELAIAATKTFSAIVVMAWILAIKFAQVKQVDITQETKDIYFISKNIEDALKNVENIDMASKMLSKQQGFAILGYSINYPLALEAALKIQETSYIHTSSYPLGEFIHGHFALLNKTKTFLIYLNSDANSNELAALRKILNTYKTKSIIISDGFNDFNCDILVKYNKGSSKIANIINMIATTQLLALKIAKRLKRNVDKPIGLKKIVDSKD